ncbi:HAD family hydrolase [Amycolatopsis sp. NPDC052450]|uniref:HAD family hydrolase n=1 Tax=Amycolatopsis sp. NPDC052450 TaxID=3363937 RepID=UPI0037C55F88
MWTDFGGVLTPPLSHTMSKFCTTMKLDPAAVMDAVGKVTRTYGTTDMMEPLDTPLVTEAEWLAQVDVVLREDHGVSTHLTTLADIWFDGRETNHEWVRALRGFSAAGLFVGLMSNMVPTWDAHWRRMVPVSELFDDVLLSFEVGCRKPDPAMFQLAAQRAGVPAGECLLVDDLEHNCAGAREAGWHAVLFDDAAGALAEMTPLITTRELA